jgi:hypothetical protein
MSYFLLSPTVRGFGKIGISSANPFANPFGNYRQDFVVVGGQSEGEFEFKTGCVVI